MLRVYSLYDRKMKSYSAPQLAMNDAVICRELSDKVPAESLQGKHPEDFDVMHLGDMDLDTGVLVPCMPVLVCNLRALVSFPLSEVQR